MTRSAIWSQAAASSIKPPSTDCSASMECGGRRSPSPAPRVRLMTRADMRYPNGTRCRKLLFGDDCDQQGHIHVRVQVQLNLVLARDANRTGRHAHFTAADRLTRFDGRLGDIGGADRAEQLALGARLGPKFQLEVFELQGARLGCSQLMAR